MEYDLDFMLEFSNEQGLKARRASEKEISIQLQDGILLSFYNSGTEDGCMMGFPDMAWHVHDNIMFSRKDGHYIELDYLEVIEGLAKRKVLIMEELKAGKVVERSLVHAEYFDECWEMQNDEEFRVKPAMVNNT